MSHVVVLGCGRVGATIARDLAADADSGLSVTAFDASPANVERLKRVAPGIRGMQADLASRDAVQSAIETADVVVGAMPSALGMQTLQTVVELGKRYCDISFMPEDALGLHEKASATGATAVVDCGVAPGLANMLIGHAASTMDEVDDVVFYVGGLPWARHWPYQYRAPFAPLDVIEEYTRPARMIEEGRVVTRPALSEPELIDFPRIGTLEAFNTDGLRSLLTTVKARNMREKTLRYPGHIELMRVLRETGYFSKEEIQVGGRGVRPIDVTAKLLFAQWTPTPGETEFTVLRVVVRGKESGVTIERRYDLMDVTDAVTGQSSMARTTGFPAAIMARMLLRGEFAEPGVFAPEQVATHEGVMKRMLSELARRGVTIETAEN